MSVPEARRFGYPELAERFWVRQAEAATELTGDAAERPDNAVEANEFRGRLHHVQLSTPPGATVTVNANGEPRA